MTGTKKTKLSLCDRTKKKLLCNPKIKMFAHPIPIQDGKGTHSLSCILEKEVPEKYFLKQETVEKILGEQGKMCPSL